MYIIEKIVRNVVTEMLTERLIKTLKLLPNVQPINLNKMSQHYKKGKTVRDGVIQDLGGYGTPIASFLVFEYDDYSNKIHTITDKGICIVQSPKSKKIITMFPINYKNIEKYYKQLEADSGRKYEVPTELDKTNINKHKSQFQKIMRKRRV